MPMGTLGLQSQATGVGPPPARMSSNHGTLLGPPMQVHEFLAAKNNELAKLCDELASLQQMIDAERACLQPTVQSKDDLHREYGNVKEKVSASASECQNLVADIRQAEDIAAQLNAWFVENASKMRTQNSWSSPSEFLESATADLRQQAEAFMESWSYTQSIMNAGADLPSTAGASLASSAQGGSRQSEAQTACPEFSQDGIGLSVQGNPEPATVQGGTLAPEVITASIADPIVQASVHEQDTHTIPAEPFEGSAQQDHPSQEHRAPALQPTIPELVPASAPAGSAMRQSEEREMDRGSAFFPGCTELANDPNSPSSTPMSTPLGYTPIANPRYESFYLKPDSSP